jgi:hypothetical protein
MDVTKLSGRPDAANRTPSAPLSPQSSTSSNVAPADRASIRPLDVAAALKILLAEIRAAFDAGDSGSELGAELGTMEDPIQGARVVVNVFLQALPDEQALPEDGAEASAVRQLLVSAESALQTGMERGIFAVSAWQDVPASVVDAAHETRALVTSVLGEEPQNPLWLRPEWAGLAPRLERYWRRRRLARRFLTDPDTSLRQDDTRDERS